MKDFIAACVQIAIEPNDVQANVNKGVRWLERAVEEHQAELVVFPETVTTGYETGLSAEELWDLVDQVPGSTTGPIQQKAAELGVHVAWPTYRRGSTRGQVYNSSVLIGSEGDIVGVYDKTHPAPWERNDHGGWAEVGQQAEVYQTELGTIGMIICYDGDFPELSRILAVKGAEIILRVSALQRSFDIWHITNAARAYDNHVYIVASNLIGADAQGNYGFGHSMIIDPIARRLAQGRGTEEIVSARLDPDPLRYITWGSRAPQNFDHLEDRNLELYRQSLQPAKSRFPIGRHFSNIQQD